MRKPLPVCSQKRVIDDRTSRGNGFSLQPKVDSLDLRLLQNEPPLCCLAVLSACPCICISRAIVFVNKIPLA